MFIKVMHGRVFSNWVLWGKMI